MPSRCNRTAFFFVARYIPALAAVFLALTVPVWAQTEVGPVTVGAGLQTSFAHTSPRGGDTTDQLQLNSVRLYVNGAAEKNIKFMFNTEFDGATNKVGVLDAVGRIELSPKFNIWAGRFLPPVIAQICTGLIMPITGMFIPTVFRTVIPSLLRDEITASSTGVISSAAN